MRFRRVSFPISAVLSIIAIVLFMCIKGINRLKKPAPAAAAPPPPRSEVLLEEIRDLLAKRV